MKVIQLKSTKSLFFLCLLVFSAFASNVTGIQNVSNLQFNNIIGGNTAQDHPSRGNWIGCWQMGVVGVLNTNNIACCRQGCTTGTAAEGAHVAINGIPGTRFILPLCHSCNSQGGDMTIRNNTSALRLQ